MKQILLLICIVIFCFFSLNCAGSYKLGRETVIVDGQTEPVRKSDNELPLEHRVPGSIPYERNVPLPPITFPTESESPSEM